MHGRCTSVRVVCFMGHGETRVRMTSKAAAASLPAYYTYVPSLPSWESPVEAHKYDMRILPSLIMTNQIELQYMSTQEKVYPYLYKSSSDS